MRTMSTVLVIVDDLDRLWAFRRPDEADAKLIVDPNTVLTPAIAPQRLELIAWRDSQRHQRHGGIQLIELSPSHPPE